MKKSVRTMVAFLGLITLEAGLAEAQQTPRDMAQADASHTMTNAGRRSSDLRVRIVYSISTTEDQDGNYRFGEAIPIESLVEQARGSTDPIVLSLMIDRCSAEPDKAGRCDAVDLARRWTVADTQNQLAWVALSTVLEHRGDAEGARAAFRRAAEAPQWHEYAPEVARLLEPVIPTTTDPVARADLLLAVVTTAWTGLPSSHYRTISHGCKDIGLRDACGRILEVMARDAQSLMTLNLATMIATSSNLPSPAVVSAMRQRTDAMWWAATHHWGTTPSTLEEAKRAVANLESLIARNEIDVFARDLQQSGLGESTAAQKFVATLSPEQIAYRGQAISKGRASAR